MDQFNKNMFLQTNTTEKTSNDNDVKTSIDLSHFKQGAVQQKSVVRPTQPQLVKMTHKEPLLVSIFNRLFDLLATYFNVNRPKHLDVNKLDEGQLRAYIDRLSIRNQELETYMERLNYWGEEFASHSDTGMTVQKISNYSQAQATTAPAVIKTTARPAAFAYTTSGQTSPTKRQPVHLNNPKKQILLAAPKTVQVPVLKPVMR